MIKRTALFALPFFLLSQLHAQTFGYFASAALLGDSTSERFYNTAPTSGTNAIGTKNFNSFLDTFPENPRALIIKGGEVKTWYNYFNSEGTDIQVCGVTLYFTVYLQGRRPPSPSFTGIPLGYFDSCSNGAFPTGGPCSLGDRKWQTRGATYSLSDYAPGNYVMEVYYDEYGTSSVDAQNPCGEHVYDNNNNNPTNYTATFTIVGAPPVPTITSVPVKVTGLCPGTPVALTSSELHNNLWSTGDTTQSIMTSNGGTYTVTATENGFSSTSAGTKITYQKCGITTLIGASAITATTATVKWNKVNCAQSYSLQYRKAGTTKYKTVTTTTPSHKITKLSANTKYEWRVQTVCTSDASSQSAYSALSNFTTAAGFTVAAETMDKNKATTLNIAPNPFANTTTISFSLAQSQKVSVQVFDLTGRLVKTIADAEMLQGNHQLRWDAKDERGHALNAGVYFLRFSAGSFTETRKLSLIK